MIYGKDQNWTLYLTYAGNPYYMNSVIERMRERFESTEFTSEAVRCELENILTDIYSKHDETLETLCCINTPHQTELYKTTKHLVTKAEPEEYLGVGETSLIRFLSSVLRPHQLNIYKATACAVYIVNQANRFVDGCSGGPDVAMIESNKRCIGIGSPEIDRLFGLQERLTQLIVSEDREFIDTALQEFSKEVNNFYDWDHTKRSKPR